MVLRSVQGLLSGLFSGLFPRLSCRLFYNIASRRILGYGLWTEPEVKP